MSKGFAAVAVATTLSLVGCGDEHPSKKEDVYNESNSEYCGASIINDYNSVVITCNHNIASQCNFKISEFLSKHPNIYCKADTTTEPKQRIIIDRKRVESLRQKKQ